MELEAIVEGTNWKYGPSVMFKNCTHRKAVSSVPETREAVFEPKIIALSFLGIMDNLLSCDFVFQNSQISNLSIHQVPHQNQKLNYEYRTLQPAS